MVNRRLGAGSELDLRPLVGFALTLADRQGLGQPEQIARSQRARHQPLVARPVDCLFEGMSNKEIARALELTEKTVKHYMTNLMNKLKVKSRLEVVLAAGKLRAAHDTDIYRPAGSET